LLTTILLVLINLHFKQSDFVAVC